MTENSMEQTSSGSKSSLNKMRFNDSAISLANLVGNKSFAFGFGGAGLPKTISSRAK